MNAQRSRRLLTYAWNWTLTYHLSSLYQHLLIKAMLVALTHNFLPECCENELCPFLILHIMLHHLHALLSDYLSCKCVTFKLHLIPQLQTQLADSSCWWTQYTPVLRWHIVNICCSVLFLNSGSRSSKTFKPKKNIPEGTHQYDLMKHAAATLGSGNLRLAVLLPEGEDLNEWVAVNSKWGLRPALSPGPFPPVRKVWQCWVAGTMSVDIIFTKIYHCTQTSLRVHHQVVTLIATLALQSYQILFSTQNGNWNCQTRNLTEHAGLPVQGVVYPQKFAKYCLFFV